MSTVRTFMDIAIGAAPAQRVMFELWPEKQPKSVENFRALCTGEKGISRLSQQPLHYKSSIFHRVIPSFMLQGGDFTKRNGSGGESIYGGQFLDEDLSIPIDSAGLLCMANRGPNTNGSQFFITLGAAEHLNGKHVVFGKVVKGYEHIEAIAEVETGEKDKPVQNITVVNCGELVRAAKAGSAAVTAGEKPQRSRSPSPSSSEPDSDSSEEARRQRKKAKRAKRKEKEDRKSGKKSGEGRDELKNVSKGPHVETMDELDARLEREENERLEADRRKRLEDMKRQLEEERKKQGSGGVVYKGRGAMRYLDPENTARHRSLAENSYTARPIQQRQSYTPRDRSDRPVANKDVLDYEGNGSSRRDRSKSPQRGSGGIDGDWRVAREAHRTRVDAVKMVPEKRAPEKEERHVAPTMKRGDSRSESDGSDMAVDE